MLITSFIWVQFLLSAIFFFNFIFKKKIKSIFFIRNVSIKLVFIFGNIFIDMGLVNSEKNNLKDFINFKLILSKSFQPNIYMYTWLKRFYKKFFFLIKKKNKNYYKILKKRLDDCFQYFLYEFFEEQEKNITKNNIKVLSFLPLKLDLNFFKHKIVRFMFKNFNLYYFSYFLKSSSFDKNFNVFFKQQTKIYSNLFLYNQNLKKKFFKKSKFFFNTIIFSSNKNDLFLINLSKFLVSKINYIFFVGLIQIIYYNLSFHQYAMSVYNGFKFDFFILFFSILNLNLLNLKFFEKYNKFLLFYFKKVIYFFKLNLIRFQFFDTSKKFITKSKNGTTIEDSMATKNFKFFSNIVLSRYTLNFYKLYLSNYLNSFTTFTWKNLNSYNIYNNYRIFKLLKFKRFNENISFKYNIKKYSIKNMKQIIFNLIYLIYIYMRSLRISYLYIKFFKRLILSYLIRLCLNLIN